MEFMPLGSLDHLLQEEKRTILIADLISMSKDAAAGMKYLHAENIIHRWHG
jgi:hypothetical protein